MLMIRRRGEDGVYIYCRLFVYIYWIFDLCGEFRVVISETAQYMRCTISNKKHKHTATILLHYQDASTCQIEKM